MSSKATTSSSLERFVAAQNGVYAQVLCELGAEDKRSHWMWFIFPQIAGLGMSTMSQKFAIASLGEAGDYLAHPVLGPRLLECTRLVMEAKERTVEQIFGSIDAMKLRSSMTLFAQIDGAPELFAQVLVRFFGGKPDEQTLSKLQR